MLTFHYVSVSMTAPLIPCKLSYYLGSFSCLADLSGVGSRTDPHDSEGIPRTADVRRRFPTDVPGQILERSVKGTVETAQNNDLKTVCDNYI